MSGEERRRARTAAAAALALAVLLAAAFFWWRAAGRVALGYRPSSPAAAPDLATAYYYPAGTAGEPVIGGLLVPISRPSAPVKARAFEALSSLLQSPAPEPGLVSALEPSLALKKVAWRGDHGVVELAGKDLAAPSAGAAGREAALIQLGETFRDAVPGLARWTVTEDGQPWGTALATVSGRRLYLPVWSGNRAYLACKAMDLPSGGDQISRGKSVLAALAVEREGTRTTGLRSGQARVRGLLPRSGEAVPTAFRQGTLAVELSPEYLARVTDPAARAMVLDIIGFNLAQGSEVQAVRFESRGQPLDRVWSGSPAMLAFPRRPNPREVDKGAAKTAARSSPRAAALTVIGDISLARKVDTLIQQHGVDYPLGSTAAILKAGDITVANLEAALSDRGRPLPNKLIWLRGKPSSAAALTRAGIDVVNLANNHILDYDTESLLQTFDVLGQNGVAYFGAGEDLSRARRPAFVEAKGVRVAFLGYNEFAPLFFSRDYPRSFEATATQSGTPPLKPAMVEADVREAKKVSDAVVVYFHWGVEETDFPLPTQRTMARGFIDAGADLVAGTHPHVLQGVEFYRGRPVFYSLGNYVYDQRKPKQVESLIFTATVTPEGLTDPRIIPVRIEEAQPRPVTGSVAAAQLKRFADLSSPLGSAVGEPAARDGYLSVPVTPQN